MGPWEIEALSTQLGKHVYDVQIVDADWSTAETIRTEMRRLGFNPETEATNLSHLLYGVFLSIADDVDLGAPPGASFDITSVYEVFGPWAPTGSGVDVGFDDPEPFPFEIAVRWYLSPDMDNPQSQHEILEFLRDVVEPLDVEYPLRFSLNLPKAASDVDEFGILRDGVKELNAGGWWINEPEEGDDDYDDEVGLTIELRHVVEFIPWDLENDDDDDGEEENGTDDDEEDDVVRWVISVPLTSDELDIVQERLIAGDSPEDALFAATGNHTFPDDDE